MGWITMVVQAWQGKCKYIQIWWNIPCYNIYRSLYTLHSLMNEYISAVYPDIFSGRGSDIYFALKCHCCYHAYFSKFFCTKECPKHNMRNIISAFWGLFNIKILRPSNLYNGISYTGNVTSLYWIGTPNPLFCHCSLLGLMATNGGSNSMIGFQ